MFLNKITLPFIKKALLFFLQNPKLIISRLKYGSFDIPSYETLIRLRQQGYQFDTVIDVGANQGQFALSALFALPECRFCYSFEPQKEISHLYQKNLNSFPAAKIFNFALG